MPRTPTKIPDNWHEFEHKNIRSRKLTRKITRRNDNVATPTVEILSDKKRLKFRSTEILIG